MIWEISELLSGREKPDALAVGSDLKFGALWIIVVLPVVWYLAEIVTMLASEKRRALHDLIAGTVVVRTNLQDDGDALDKTSPHDPPKGTLAKA